MRYHDNGWQELTTTIVNEDAVYVYYEATTPGLSTFAIASIVGTPPGGSSYLMIIVVAIAIAAVMAVLYFKKRF